MIAFFAFVLFGGGMFSAGRALARNDTEFPLFPALVIGCSLMILAGELVVRRACPASAIEARQGGNGVAGAVEDESAIREAETPKADEGSKP